MSTLSMLFNGYKFPTGNWSHSSYVLFMDMDSLREKGLMIIYFYGNYRELTKSICMFYVVICSVSWH